MTVSKLGMSIATVMLLAGAVIGQAQQAQQTEKAPQAANAAAAASFTATAPGKATASAPSAAKSPADTQAADSGLSAQQLKRALDDGFKPVTQHNVTVYCKSEMLIGSSFPIRTCYKADRMKLLLEREGG